MSKPNYLRKGDAPASILIKAENFVIYLFNITNNEKQFPKAYRYTLVSDIRTTALDMHKNITKALSIHPRSKKNTPRASSPGSIMFSLTLPVHHPEPQQPFPLHRKTGQEQRHPLLFPACTDLQYGTTLHDP